MRVFLTERNPARTVFTFFSGTCGDTCCTALRRYLPLIIVVAPGIDYETFQGEPVCPKDPKSIHHPVPDRVRVVRL